MCYVCRETESVWACLSCSNVACGRFNQKHALQHYQESKHPISIEVNEKYVYCYVCDDYVLNDNAAGDLKLLRSALSAVTTQKFTDIESRGRHLLRSYSHTGIIQRQNTDENDILATAQWHERQTLMAKVFSAWRNFVLQKKQTKQTTPKKKQLMPAPAQSPVPKKRMIIPGITGLRNLGNTCYMNSILQVLSYIDEFREFFLKMKFDIDVSPHGSPQVSQIKMAQPSSATRRSKRLNTVDCFQHLMSSTPSTSKTSKQRKGGLNGGSNQNTPMKQLLICNVESKSSDAVSLCGELHGLFRVLWSGKWAQVSPHAFLRAVWQSIPWFKGYAQHDAQEFLCELLDKVQRELDKVPRFARDGSSKFLENLFQGQLVSQVTCLQCKNVSQCFEPYMDLSLEFPERYQITKSNSRIAQDICHVTEMLAKFTEEEKLEGKIYSCERCNSNRRRSAGPLHTEAKKQFLINKLPPILRLHLKRFRWCGRDHREKISTHVATDEVLDLQPFCTAGAKDGYKYQLFAVVIHHGRGFGSGHYTAYTWNREADSWVNCNDSRMLLCQLEEVLQAQSYILFYKRISAKQEKLSPLTKTSSESSDSLPCSLESEDSLRYSLASEDTVKYSLNAEDTVILDSDENITRQSKSSPAVLSKHGDRRWSEGSAKKDKAKTLDGSVKESSETDKSSCLNCNVSADSGRSDTIVLENSFDTMKMLSSDNSSIPGTPNSLETNSDSGSVSGITPRSNSKYVTRSQTGSLKRSLDSDDLYIYGDLMYPKRPRRKSTDSVKVQKAPQNQNNNNSPAAPPLKLVKEENHPNDSETKPDNSFVNNTVPQAKRRIYDVEHVIAELNKPHHILKRRKSNLW